jgi:hypothetical protein
LKHLKTGVKQRFRSLTEAIDTETPTGRATWQMIGVLAELERSLIVERTRAGVKAAQKTPVTDGKVSPSSFAWAVGAASAASCCCAASWKARWRSANRIPTDNNC